MPFFAAPRPVAVVPSGSATPDVLLPEAGIDYQKELHDGFVAALAMPPATSVALPPRDASRGARRVPSDEDVKALARHLVATQSGFLLAGIWWYKGASQGCASRGQDFETTAAPLYAEWLRAAYPDLTPPEAIERAAALVNALREILPHGAGEFDEISPLLLREYAGRLGGAWPHRVETCLERHKPEQVRALLFMMAAHHALAALAPAHIDGLLGAAMRFDLDAQATIQAAVTLARLAPAARGEIDALAARLPNQPEIAKDAFYAVVVSDRFVLGGDQAAHQHCRERLAHAVQEIHGLVESGEGEKRLSQAGEINALGLGAAHAENVIVRSTAGAIKVDVRAYPGVKTDTVTRVGEALHRVLAKFPPDVARTLAVGKHGCPLALRILAKGAVAHPDRGTVSPDENTAAIAVYDPDDNSVALHIEGVRRAGGDALDLAVARALARAIRDLVDDARDGHLRPTADAARDALSGVRRHRLALAKERQAAQTVTAAKAQPETAGARDAAKTGVAQADEKSSAEADEIAATRDREFVDQAITDYVLDPEAQRRRDPVMAAMVAAALDRVGRAGPCDTRRDAGREDQRRDDQRREFLQSARRLFVNGPAPNFLAEVLGHTLTAFKEKNAPIVNELAAIAHACEAYVAIAGAFEGRQLDDAKSARVAELGALRRGAHVLLEGVRARLAADPCPARDALRGIEKTLSQTLARLETSGSAHRPADKAGH